MFARFRFSPRTSRSCRFRFTTAVSLPRLDRSMGLPVDPEKTDLGMSLVLQVDGRFRIETLPPRLQETLRLLEKCRKVYIHIRVYIRVESVVFEVLADSTRRRIVETLGAGERPVHALVEAVDIQQSGVSRHLRILHEAGFVRVRAEGQERLYSLCAEPFRELDEWMRQYRGLWEARLDRFGAELNRRQKARAGRRRETPSR